MRRLAPLAAVLGLAAVAGPAVADVRFEGRTSQGRFALLVAEDDGVPKRSVIRWRGTFGARVIARRGGRAIDRCAALGVRWSARH